MENEGGEQGFSAEGAVVEILERGGERFAKILIEPGTVLELPAGSVEMSLGDRVLVDASLNITQVRASKTGAPGAVAAGFGARHADATGPGGTSAHRRPTLRDYQHVVRMAGLFLLAVVSFLVWRSWMVPPDFGVYGHYRAGAITDAARRTPLYAGQAACVVCHDDVQQVRATGRHANVRCEACHGPLGRHARAETDVAPIRPSSRGVCLTCHTSKDGMPKAFPKIVVNEHSESGPCTDCHKSHAPGMS
jgi:hypothetical protein